MACLATVSALGAALVLAAAGDDRLTIGTEAPFPPYVMLTETGALTGFEHEVMTEICRRQHLTCEWQLVTFDELVPGVMEGRFDVVLGGMAITPERVGLVDFSTPYHFSDDTEWFMGKPGAPAPEAATVAVQAGTLHESYLRNEGLDFRAYPTESATLDAVSSGQADLAFGPFENREDLQPRLDAAGLQALYHVELQDDGTAMAVCKGNDALLRQLDAALAAMAADGTLATLESRWFF